MLRVTARELQAFCDAPNCFLAPLPLLHLIQSGMWSSLMFRGSWLRRGCNAAITTVVQELGVVKSYFETGFAGRLCEEQKTKKRSSVCRRLSGCSACTNAAC